MKKIWGIIREIFDICLIVIVLAILAFLSIFKEEYRFNDEEDKRWWK